MPLCHYQSKVHLIKGSPIKALSFIKLASLQASRANGTKCARMSQEVSKWLATMLYSTCVNNLRLFYRGSLNHSLYKFLWTSQWDRVLSSQCNHTHLYPNWTQTQLSDPFCKTVVASKNKFDTYISKKSPIGPTERTPNPENLMALAIYIGVRW